MDFVSENLVPWHIKDKRVFFYELIPAQTLPTEDLIDKANLRRAQGQSIGLPPLVPPPGPVEGPPILP